RADDSLDSLSNAAVRITFVQFLCKDLRIGQPSNQCESNQKNRKMRRKMHTMFLCVLPALPFSAAKRERGQMLSGSRAPGLVLFETTFRANCGNLSTVSVRTQRCFQLQNALSSSSE